MIALLILSDEHYITSLRKLSLDFLKDHLTLEEIPEILQIGFDKKILDLIWIALSHGKKQSYAILEDCLNKKNLAEYSLEVKDAMNILKELSNSYCTLGEMGEVVLSETLFEQSQMVVKELILIEKLATAIPLSLTIHDSYFSDSLFRSLGQLCPSLRNLTVYSETRLDLSIQKSFNKLESFGQSLFFKEMSEVKSFIENLDGIKLNTLCLEGGEILDNDLINLSTQLPELIQLFLKDTKITQIPFQELKSINFESCENLEVLFLKSVKTANLIKCKNLSQITLPSVEYFNGKKIGILELVLPKAKHVILKKCNGTEDFHFFVQPFAS
ncbi:MAG: hypothetical protein H0T62_02240 [Parachlamydiaceae bacterium]|nr:hypothetical protein [Parachlamydiaceae bacterium]